MECIKNSLEPEPGWIQKLLCMEGFKGIRREVIVEGPFYQLGAGNSLLRRVHLGLTTAELVIVSQNLYNIQEEENGFDFDELLPLPLIRLFIPSPQITRLIICTCCGDVLHFQLDHKSAGDASMHLWENWWEEIRKISGSETSKTDGYIIWNSKYIITSDELSQIRRNPEYKTPRDRTNILVFAQHTPDYRCVRSVPVQTLNIDRPTIVHLGLNKQIKESLRKESLAMCEKRGQQMKAKNEKIGDQTKTRTSGYAEVLIPVWYPEDHKIATYRRDLKKSMSSPSLIDSDHLYPGHVQRIFSNKTEEDSFCLRESSSLIDTVSTMSALTEECGEFDKVLSYLLVGCKPDSKELDPNLFRSYKKMDKFRRKAMSNKRKLKTSLCEVESSDSDFSIDVIVDEIKTRTRSGAELWQIARRLVMAKRTGTHLDDLVQTVVFKTYASKYNLCHLSLI
ncbi:hypothetical protein CHS0354_010358 [Potamilus streckersoni]|uniref:Uncharacterized protein n=1 Tax=Potamilus streckersoni TaxID=2493646 RepID=A0AAE0WCH6_9BIVA|nr:hypothetical protein CHS0354_010358 [Potamilus streckersoni]